MTLSSSLSRALARSARSSSSSFRPPRQGSLLEWYAYAGLRSAPPPRPSVPGVDGGGLGFARSYLTSAALRGRTAATTGARNAGDSRFFLASSQFRRLCSNGSNKNYDKYYPKEKQEKPEEDGSDKSDSKSE